jgi:hypothetical protein
MKTYFKLSIILYVALNSIFGANSSRGSFYFYTTKFCFVRDCALNSVDSVYGLVNFMSRMHSNEFDRVSFDLFENEYLDIFMITPPKSFYFSWGIYLMDRWYDYKINQYGASLNDTINSFFIHQQLQTLDPFDKEIRLFVAHNPNIILELEKLYGGQKNVFFLSFNAFDRNMIPFNSTGDRLSLFFRILMPNNWTQLNDYIKYPPVSVYRYKMNVEDKVLKPVGIWKKRSNYGTNENINYLNEFQHFAQNMKRYMKNKIRKNNEMELVSKPHRDSIQYDSGWDCIKYKKSCWVDNRDTVYIGTGVIQDQDIYGFPFKNDSLLLVMGLNHTFFHNSMYHSLQLYDATNEQGFYSFHGFEDKYDKSKSYNMSCHEIYNYLDFTGLYPYPTEQFYCILISRMPIEYWNFPIHLKNFYKQVSFQELPSQNLFKTVERSYLQNIASISSVHEYLVRPYGVILY